MATLESKSATPSGYAGRGRNRAGPDHIHLFLVPALGRGLGRHPPVRWHPAWHPNRVCQGGLLRRGSQWLHSRRRRVTQRRDNRSLFYSSFFSVFPVGMFFLFGASWSGIRDSNFLITELDLLCNIPEDKYGHFGPGILVCGHRCGQTLSTVGTMIEIGGGQRLRQRFLGRSERPWRFTGSVCSISL